MLSAERIAAESKYSGHMYYHYEPKWSWERPEIRAFGRVNGGLVFSGRREPLILSLAHRFGPDPPFRVVTDCKAHVKLCILLPSCSPRCPDTREIIIGV
jgi:hypothetical protein